MVMLLGLVVVLAMLAIGAYGAYPVLKQWYLEEHDAEPEAPVWSGGEYRTAARRFDEERPEPEELVLRRIAKASPPLDELSRGAKRWRRRRGSTGYWRAEDGSVLLSSSYEAAVATRLDSELTSLEEAAPLYNKPTPVELRDHGRCFELAEEEKRRRQTEAEAAEFEARVTRERELATAREQMARDLAQRRHELFQARAAEQESIARTQAMLNRQEDSAFEGPDESDPRTWQENYY